MKSTAQLGLAAVALFTSSVISLGSVYYFLHQIKDDVRVVNAAGIVRGGTQRLIKLELAGQKSDESIADIDRLINGLIHGDSTLGLPAATDPEVLRKNQAIAESWENLKTIILAFRENQTQRNRLILKSESHWDLTNEAVFEAEVWSKRKLDRYQIIFLILFSVNLACLGFIFWLMFSIQLKIKNSIKNLAIFSTQMAAVITEQEAITGQQAIAVNQSSQMMFELTHISHESVEQATQVNHRAGEVKQFVQYGKKTEQQMLSDMANLNKKVEELHREIMDLRQQTQQIAKISQLVSELGNHTNMLALNASMEATRAGEHGKEFAVVAKEIRKLANQTKKAAEKIYMLVSHIQNAIKSTVLVTNESSATVHKGVNQTTAMIEAFQEVVNGLDTVFVSSEKITLHAQQQAAIIQEALSAIEEINRSAQESARGMSYAKNDMEQLKQVVINLDAIV